MFQFPIHPIISIALKRGKSGNQNIPWSHKSYLNSATPIKLCLLLAEICLFLASVLSIAYHNCGTPQKLLHQRSFCWYMVRSTEIFSLGSDGASIFATSAFNNRNRDEIAWMPLHLERLPKTIREKNPEDCRELSHQWASVKRGQALGLLVRLSFIPLRTST